MSSDALAVARGAVRDGGAALEHFVQVLASRRVGPRVLARAVPEVQAGCGSLLGALRALEAALEAELGEDTGGVDAVRGLLAYAAKQVEALEAGLASNRSRSTSMDARTRLALETLARPIAGDLGSVVRLVDMVGAPVTSARTAIDFDDALAARRSPQRSTATPVLAVVDVRSSELRVGDARLVLELLEFCVATVVRAGVEAPRILVEAGADGAPSFTVDAAPRHTTSDASACRVLDVILRDELPREADVVRAAARRAGIELVVAADGRSVSLSH